MERALVLDVTREREFDDAVLYHVHLENAEFVQWSRKHDSNERIEKGGELQFERTLKNYLKQGWRCGPSNGAAPQPAQPVNQSAPPKAQTPPRRSTDPRQQSIERQSCMKAATDMITQMVCTGTISYTNLNDLTTHIQTTANQLYDKCLSQ